MELKSVKHQLIIVAISSLLVTFSFQNCAQRIDSNTLLSTKENPTILSESILNEVPFAFDMRVNEVAYMSCSHSDVDKTDKNHMSNPEFFTFKVQAIGENNGVGLRKEFKTYLVDKFGDQNYQVDKNTLESALVDAPSNALASVQLAVRPLTDPVKLVVNLNSPTYIPKNGTDFSYFLSQSPLYSALNYDQNLKQIMDLFTLPLVSRLNYFLQKETDHTLSASINFHHSSNYLEFTAETARTDFSKGQGSNILTISYTNDLRNSENLKNPYYSRTTNSDSNNKSLIWGTGLKLGFSMEERVNGIGYSNVLNSVSELELHNGQTPTGAKWDCNIRYLIISPYDNDETNSVQFPHPTDSTKTFSRCSNPVATAGGNLNSAQLKELQILQRYLPATDWIIDPINKCIVPNKGVGDCYPNRNPTGANRQVMYYGANSSENCGASLSNSNKDCPEFISLCIRQAQ